MYGNIWNISSRIYDLCDSGVAVQEQPQGRGGDWYHRGEVGRGQVYHRGEVVRGQVYQVW